MTIVMHNAGAFLRETRESHLLTQKELATRAHTMQSSISRIECGHVSPTIRELTRLLRVMGDELGLVALPIEETT